MKKLISVFALAGSLGLAVAAQAVCIQNLNGQSCGDLLGQWHFVNNQTDGAPAGSLLAHFSGDPAECSTGPSKVNSHTQHFNCSATGALLDACTNLPGNLVLSDFTCSPPKCTDPKGCPPPCTDPKGCEPPPCTGKKCPK